MREPCTGRSLAKRHRAKQACAGDIEGVSVWIGNSQAACYTGDAPGTADVTWKLWSTG